MANEIADALRKASNKIASYVEDIAEMKVTTYCTRTDATGEATKPTIAASTTIKLDGDNQSIVPARQTDMGLVVESAIFDVHQANVKAAIEYRAQMLSSLLTILQTARKL